MLKGKLLDKPGYKIKKLNGKYELYHEGKWIATHNTLQEMVNYMIEIDAVYFGRPVESE